MTSDAQTLGFSLAQRNYALFVLTLVYVFNVLDRNVLTILIDPIREDLGISDAQIGVLTGVAFAVAYAVTALPMGRLADRANRIRIIAGCAGFWSICTALFGLAGQFSHMVLARIGVAVGEAGAYTTTMSLFGDLFPPERRATAISIFMVGGTIGVSAGFAGAGMLNDAVGWRTTFVVLGLIGLGLAPLALFTVREPQRGQIEGLDAGSHAPIGTRDALKTLWGRKSWVMIVLAFMVSAISVQGTQAWLPTYYMRKFDLSPGEIGQILAIAGPLPVIAGTLLGGVIGDRLFKRDPRFAIWMPAIAVLIAPPFLITALFAPSLFVAIVAGIVPYFTGGLTQAPLTSLLLALPGPSLRATASGVMTVAVVMVGQGLGPSLVGIVSSTINVAGSATHTSLGYALTAAIFINVLAGLILVFAGPFLKKDLASARRLEEQLANE